MHFSYDKLMALGAHVGSSKQNYNKQVGFYALGFRNSVFIFDAHKMLVNIINILIIIRKLYFSHAAIMGLGARMGFDMHNVLKTFFFQFGQSWVFGQLVGGSLSNKKVSLWKTSRWALPTTDYYYQTELSPDAYFLLQTLSNQSVIAEIQNDFSLLLGLSDSNLGIDGLTYVVPFNTKSIQPLFYFFSLISFYFSSGKARLQAVAQRHYNLQFYSLYLSRLLALRSSVHKSTFYYNTHRRRYFKKALVYAKLLVLTNYTRHSSYLRKRVKPRKKPILNLLGYHRFVLRSILRFYFLRRWGFFAKKAFILSYRHHGASNLDLTRYHEFFKFGSYLRALRSFSYFLKNKRFVSKLFESGSYRHFLSQNLKKKSVRPTSFFYRSARFYNTFLGLGSVSSLKKNFLLLSKRQPVGLRYITILRYLKKKLLFANFFLPQEWVYYRKYNKYSQNGFKTTFIWYLDPRKHYHMNVRNMKREKRIKFKHSRSSFQKRFQSKFKKKKRFVDPYAKLKRESLSVRDADGVLVNLQKLPAYINYKKTVAEVYAKELSDLQRKKK